MQNNKGIIRIKRFMMKYCLLNI